MTEDRLDPDDRFAGPYALIRVWVANASTPHGFHVGGHPSQWYRLDPGGALVLWQGGDQYVYAPGAWREVECHIGLPSDEVLERSDRDRLDAREA